jgi:hypothetical protein
VVGVRLQIPHVNVAFGPVSAKLPADTADPLSRVAPPGMSTTRCFRYVDGYWCQCCHHGGIDDPDALRAYRQAIGA